MGADDGAPDAHADHDCASVNILSLAGFFDLTVSKAGPAHCNTGGECVYDLVVTNDGPDDYSGGMALKDTMPAGATFLSFTSTDPWICLAAPPDINCGMIGPLLMHPGDSYSLSLKIKLPDPIPGGATTVHNCAELPWSTGGLPANDNPAPPFDAVDSQCIDTPVDGGFDLQISKEGPLECYEGHICDYEISVKNGGPAPFTGLVAVTDTLPAGRPSRPLRGRSPAPGSRRERTAAPSHLGRSRQPRRSPITSESSSPIRSPASVSTIAPRSTGATHSRFSARRSILATTTRRMTGRLA